MAIFTKIDAEMLKDRIMKGKLKSTSMEIKDPRFVIRVLATNIMDEPGWATENVHFFLEIFGPILPEHYSSSLDQLEPFISELQKEKWTVGKGGDANRYIYSIYVEPSDVDKQLRKFKKVRAKYLP